MKAEHMEAVCAELVKRGVPATYEYPGYIEARVGPRLIANAGDANATIGMDLCDPEGVLQDSVQSTIPSATEDITAVVDFIAEWWTRAFEVSKEESSEEDWRICWNPEPTDAAG